MQQAMISLEWLNDKVEKFNNKTLVQKINWIFCSLDTNEISFVIFHYTKVDFHIMHVSANRKGKGIMYH